MKEYINILNSILILLIYGHFAFDIWFVFFATLSKQHLPFALFELFNLIIFFFIGIVMNNFEFENPEDK